MTLNDIAAGMRQFADINPLDPLKAMPPDMLPYHRPVAVNGYTVHIIFTRTALVYSGGSYHLAISRKTVDKKVTPSEVVAHIQQVFLPEGIDLSNLSNNTYQFMAKVQSCV